MSNDKFNEDTIYRFRSFLVSFFNCMYNHEFI